MFRCTGDSKARGFRHENCAEQEGGRAVGAGDCKEDGRTRPCRLPGSVEAAKPWTSL